MSRSPQVTFKMPLSASSNRHTPSSFSNISVSESQRRLEDLTREREQLRSRIVQQKQRNEQLRREIQKDYQEYNQKIEASNQEVTFLKTRYAEYQREIEEMSKKVEAMGL